MALPGVFVNSHSLSAFSPLKAVLFLDRAGSVSSFPAHSVLFIFLALLHCRSVSAMFKCAWHGATLQCQLRARPWPAHRHPAVGGRLVTARALAGGTPAPAPTPQRACPWLRRLRGPGHCQSPHLPFETRPGLSGPKSPAHVAPSPLPGPARPLLVLSNPRGRLLVAHAPHGSGQQARARAFSASPPLQAQTSTEPETAPFGPVGGQCGTGGGERLDGRFSSRVRVPRTESHCTAEPRHC